MISIGTHLEVGWHGHELLHFLEVRLTDFLQRRFKLEPLQCDEAAQVEL